VYASCSGEVFAYGALTRGTGMEVFYGVVNDTERRIRKLKQIYGEHVVGRTEKFIVTHGGKGGLSWHSIESGERVFEFVLFDTMD
jgi:hypothetical protein